MERQDRPPVGPHMLTLQQKRMLLLYVKGYAYVDIAIALGIRNREVLTEMNSIFAKIGGPDRLQAARWAAKHL